MPKKRITRKNNTLLLGITVNGKPEWAGRGVWEAAQKLSWIGSSRDKIGFLVEGIEYNLPPQDEWHHRNWKEPVVRDTRKWLVDHIKRCIEIHEEFYLEGEKNNDRKLRG